MSERTSRQAISQLALTLFERGGAERVIVGAMPKNPSGKILKRQLREEHKDLAADA